MSVLYSLNTYSRRMSWQPGQFGSKKVSSNFLHCQKKNKKLTTYYLNFKTIVLSSLEGNLKDPYQQNWSNMA